MKYIKKKLPAQVELSATEKTISTPEGAVLCRLGDAIMTGVTGEHWPISRAQFEASYEAVPPTVMGQSGLYEKRPFEVDARQALAATQVTLADGHGVLTVKVGDWIVTGPDGQEWVVDGNIFAATYSMVAAKG